MPTTRTQSVSHATHRPASASAPMVRVVSRSGRLPMRAAFSLIELVIVISIIAIMASVASVRYAGALTTYRIDAAAKRLQADLDGARTRARTLGTSVYVEFTVASSTYSIRTRAEADDGVPLSTTNSNGPMKQDLRTAPYNARISKFTSSSGLQRAIFEPTGACSTSLQIVLVVGERERTVELDAGTGQSIIR